MTDRFDDIRPYRDDEIPAAMHRVTANALFPGISAFVYPGRDVEEVRRAIRGYRSVDEFQSRAMKAFVEQVIARSVARFSYTGTRALDREKAYLFVSNHRDITLDSSFLQYALHREGFRTTEITFGSNLMSSPLIVDIGKSNKMFTFARGGTFRAFHANSRRLSAYIRHAITGRGTSIWIAQRDGRTKDGRDVTNKGIISMFRLSSPGDPVDALTALNITPVSISYEWEPCDLLKALEIYHSRKERYVKKPGEDLHAILTGITAAKGRVHLNIGKPLAESDLLPLAVPSPARFNERVAALVDRQVNGLYSLTCNNYIADDLLRDAARHARHYSPDERCRFTRHYHAARDAARDRHGVRDIDTFASIFLGIYAHPVTARGE
ncbi:MAG: acyltransferase [Odoribacteraceae bacterium]|jgi:hypothetical protein|nr:acyltransferase [Odoribacteraceae bacterium]